MAASAAQDGRQGCSLTMPMHFGFEKKQRCKSNWLALKVLDEATFNLFMKIFAEARASTATRNMQHPLAKVVAKLVRHPSTVLILRADCSASYPLSLFFSNDPMEARLVTRMLIRIS